MNLEMKVLKIISEKELMSKKELEEFIKKLNCNEKALDTILKNLIEKRYIASLNCIGSNAFVITQCGKSALE